MYQFFFCLLCCCVVLLVLFLFLTKEVPIRENWIFRTFAYHQIAYVYFDYYILPFFSRWLLDWCIAVGVCVYDTLQEIFVDERSLFCIHLLWVTGVFIIKLTRDVAGNVVVLTHKLHTNFKSLFFIIIILNSHFLLFFKTHWKHACSLFLCAPCFHVINSTCTC